MLVDSIKMPCSLNAKDLHLICLQDTTEYNFQPHFNRLKEGTLGVIDNNISHGFLSHVMVCFDAKNTLPIGISYCKQWSRDPDRKRKHERNYPNLEIEEKESFRWIEAAEKTKDLLRESNHITFVSDRESDIYQFWSRIPDQNTDLIIRARTDRRLYDNPLSVFQTLNEQNVAGSYLIQIKGDKRKNRTGRNAKLNVKYTNVCIRKPKSVKETKINDPDFLSLFVIEAKEDIETIPPGESAVHWILFTTHKISNLDQAKQIIQWYCFRWQIEQFFRITKKQGFDLESSQLESGEGLMKLQLIVFVVALKILQLTLARDGTVNDEAIKYYDADELTVLEMLNNQLQGDTKKQQNPFPTKTLAWVAWIIARLGGYSGYKSQSPPGPITYKWGLDKFFQISQGFRLAKDVYKE